MDSPGADEGVVTEQDLPTWLLQHIPALTDTYKMEVQAHYGMEADDLALKPSAYFVLSFVLKPYMTTLLDANETHDVQGIFDLLEYLARRGDASVQNELGVMMEEVDIWRIWAFLGPTMRADVFDAVTWFPEWASRTERMNVHVDRDHYRRRWREEIDAGGGWERFTDDNQMRIRHQLVREFNIIRLRAIDVDNGA